MGIVVFERSHCRILSVVRSKKKNLILASIRPIYTQKKDYLTDRKPFPSSEHERN